MMLTGYEKGEAVMKKGLVILAGVLLVSSALIAAPVDRGNCSATASPTTTTWSHSYGLSPNTACSQGTHVQQNGTVVRDSSLRTSTDRGIGQIMKDLIKHLGFSPDTTVWSFGPPIK